MVATEKERMTADIVIAGASAGGVMAAYSALTCGKTVIMTEKTDWIGGQFTSQAVPPDEHIWIEEQGCTRTYREFREKVRAHYRSLSNIIDEQRNNPLINPGTGLVSRISHEPTVGLKIFQDMLAPYIASGALKILYNTEIISLLMSEGIVKEAVTKGGHNCFLEFKYFLDATDCGDMLPLTGLPYASGAESRAETGELHAATVKNRLDIQCINYVGAIEYNPAQRDVSMGKPAEYGFFKKHMLPFDKSISLLSWYAPHLNERNNKPRRFTMFKGELDEYGQEHFPLFDYRQITASKYYLADKPLDATIVNWPQNDYFFDNIYESEDDPYNLYMAKQLTLSVIYYFNTEAPRANGKRGYIGFNMRGDLVGTKDGLAKAPYIRESRRIKAVKPVTENMICRELNKTLPIFSDSVGVGSYHIDVHMTTKTKSYFFYEVQPFEIPLSAMIPKDMDNFLPSCKNIGATHLTNGCYRLHPVEWNIGESAGFLAAFCIENNIRPKEVAENPEKLRLFQDMLINYGIQLHWKL